MTHDYLTSKGLTNLVWVWSIKDVNTGSFADYYPGDEYVDVIGLDSWMKAFPSHETYRRVLDVAHGKPIALAEVGTIPTPEQLIAQPRWAYFMVWSEHLTDSRYNSRARVKRTYAAARVLTRDRVSRGSAPGANPANAAENLALGQPIWASSIDAAGRKPDKAVDGETRTRWSSAYADSQWIYVDLQRSYAIDGVTISWETAYAKKFQIQVSNDQNTWTTIYQNDAGNGGASTIKLAGQRARYVKIYAWERGTKWGYSVWEFTVQGR